MLTFGEWLKESAGLSLVGSSFNDEPYQEKGVMSKNLAMVARPTDKSTVDPDAMFTGRRGKKKSRRSK